MRLAFLVLTAVLWVALESTRAPVSAPGMPDGFWTSPPPEGAAVQAQNELDQSVLTFDRSAGTVAWTSPGTAGKVPASAPVPWSAERLQLLLYHGPPGGEDLRPAGAALGRIPPSGCEPPPFDMLAFTADVPAGLAGRIAFDSFGEEETW